MLPAGQLISTPTIGSSTIGRALAMASRNALRPAEMNATSFESTGWYLPSYDVDPDVVQREARERPGRQHLLDALLHGGNERRRNRAAFRPD